ncbi:hypothetical protein CEXT_83801 [Caerostris extrusa]|uniref:Uncharacterized protein n=1 Tax=Caerostris extrusa TaxID=172846 RepID=A0AAV4XP20_CAEEX|nr:hypothetical protein CEXT_83801 [Caerostris extrusa]
MIVNCFSVHENIIHHTLNDGVHDGDDVHDDGRDVHDDHDDDRDAHGDGDHDDGHDGDHGDGHGGDHDVRDDRDDGRGGHGDHDDDALPLQHLGGFARNTLERSDQSGEEKDGNDRLHDFQMKSCCKAKCGFHHLVRLEIKYYVRIIHHILNDDGHDGDDVRDDGRGAHDDHDDDRDAHGDDGRDDDHGGGHGGDRDVHDDRDDGRGDHGDHGDALPLQHLDMVCSKHSGKKRPKRRGKRWQ